MIYEVRPAWHGPVGEYTWHGVAKFRYVEKHDHWLLYWLRAERSETLLARVEQDSSGAFWG